MEERKLSELKANPQNPRGAVTHDIPLRELAASIKSQGVLQPIIITPNNNIVAGHRRVEAAKLAGLDSIPVIVKKLSLVEQIALMLTENLQRADLNVLQEGAAYALLVEHGLAPTQIAKAIGVTGQRVADCIAIQSLPPDVQGKFAMNMLPTSCASPLAALSRAEEQIHWAHEASRNKLNGAALRNAISREGHEIRKPSASPRQLIGGTIARLQRVDEQLEHDEQFSEIQSLLREAIRQLYKMKQSKAA